MNILRAMKRESRAEKGYASVGWNLQPLALVVVCAVILCGCRTDRLMATPPPGADIAYNGGYGDAVRHWQSKHGRGYPFTIPKCVWVDKTQWTTDAKGNPLEMGGWNLNENAFAMWVGQYPLRGSIQHECEHCFDLQVFGKTSEESVR